MSNYLKQGIDIWSSENSGGRALGNLFGNVAAIGQATQTVLDQGAYLINSYGAFQGLVANGYLTGSLLGRHGVTVNNSVKQILNQYTAKDPVIVAEIAIIGILFIIISSIKTFNATVFPQPDDPSIAQ